MPIIQRTRLALLDLDQIWDYIARDNVRAADRFLDKIQTRCEMLARQPLLGEARDDLGSGIREFPVGNYIIFYHPSEQGIEVVRVLHGARNIRRLT